MEIYNAPHVISSNRISRILIIVIAGLIIIPIQIESEIVHDPVKVQIKNGVAFRLDRRDRYRLLDRRIEIRISRRLLKIADIVARAGMIQAEPFVMTIRSADRDVILILIVVEGKGDGLADPAGADIGFLQVISRPIRILRIDDDRIGRIGQRRPFCIEIRGSIDLSAKGESRAFDDLSVAVRIRFSGNLGIPPTEVITISLHCQSGLGRNFSGLDELRCVVCTALAVFIENHPVAFRCIYGKGHITVNRDRSLVCINGTLSIAGNMVSTLFDIPAFKAVRVIRRGVRHVDRIGNGRLFVRIRDLKSAQSDALFVQIRDRVELEEHGVEFYRVHVSCDILLFGPGADIGYGLLISQISRRVCRLIL